VGRVDQEEFDDEEVTMMMMMTTTMMIRESNRFDGRYHAIPARSVLRWFWVAQ
jgi:hypothetical protein